MLYLLREGIHGVLPTGSSSPEGEAPFGGSTSPMLSAVCCVPHFSLPPEMFNGTPQSSGLVEHPLVPVFTNRQAETDLPNLLIT